MIVVLMTPVRCASILMLIVSNIVFIGSSVSIYVSPVNGNKLISINKELNFQPKYSSDKAILESYNDFLLGKDLINGSLHQKKIANKKLARFVPFFLKIL